LDQTGHLLLEHRRVNQQHQKPKQPEDYNKEFAEVLIYKAPQCLSSEQILKQEPPSSIRKPIPVYSPELIKPIVKNP